MVKGHEYVFRFLASFKLRPHNIVYSVLGSLNLKEPTRLLVSGRCNEFSFRKVHFQFGCSIFIMQLPQSLGHLIAWKYFFTKAFDTCTHLSVWVFTCFISKPINLQWQVLLLLANLILRSKKSKLYTLAKIDPIVCVESNISIQNSKSGLFFLRLYTCLNVELLKTNVF